MVALRNTHLCRSMQPRFEREALSSIPFSADLDLERIVSGPIAECSVLQDVLPGIAFCSLREERNGMTHCCVAVQQQKSACRNKNERTWKERGERRERKKERRKGVLDWAGNPRRRLLTLLMPLLIKLGHILELKGRDWIVHVYTGENKGSFVLISRTQAGPCRTVQQEQEEISRNHVQSF